MMKKWMPLLCLVSLLTLSACGSREDADKKLARGCEAAVKSMLAKDTEDRQVEAIKGKSFAPSGENREVTLQATTKNKEFGYEAEESFKCVFEESYSPGFTAWKASLLQLRIGETVYGSEGGEIFGTMEDQMSLTAAVESAMR